MRSTLKLNTIKWSQLIWIWKPKEQVHLCIWALNVHLIHSKTCMTDLDPINFGPNRKLNRLSVEEWENITFINYDTVIDKDAVHCTDGHLWVVQNQFGELCDEANMKLERREAHRNSTNWFSLWARATLDSVCFCTGMALLTPFRSEHGLLWLTQQNNHGDVHGVDRDRKPIVCMSMLPTLTVVELNCAWSTCGLAVCFQSHLWHHPWLKHDWTRFAAVLWSDANAVLWVLKFNHSLLWACLPIGDRWPSFWNASWRKKGCIWKIYP